MEAWSCTQKTLEPALQIRAILFPFGIWIQRFSVKYVREEKRKCDTSNIKCISACNHIQVPYSLGVLLLWGYYAWRGSAVAGHSLHWENWETYSMSYLLSLSNIECLDWEWLIGKWISCLPNRWSRDRCIRTNSTSYWSYIFYLHGFSDSRISRISILSLSD